MSIEIARAQFIGDIIGQVLLICVGIYVAWIRPSRIRSAVTRGQLTTAEAEGKAKAIRPWLGYLVLAYGIYALTRQAFE